MRPSVASNPAEAGRGSFAGDVSYFLSLTPRQLPSRYLYDDVGSALFEVICRLPWYSVARTERQLLRDHAEQIFGHLEDLMNVVELGPGSGEKLATLLAGSPHQGLTIHLVDVSRAALDLATRTLDSYPAHTVVVHQTTYEAGLAAIRGSSAPADRSLSLFLGSNIGNFDEPGATTFLKTLRHSLHPGDALLLGTDLVKPEAELLLAYDDPLGVTAAFNRNLLVRINRELGADFDLDGFAHRAVWNASASRVEMHLVSVRPQRARVLAGGLALAFDAGETIWTESSYKYRLDDIVWLLGRAGFTMIEQWVADGFALSLARAV